MPLLREGDLRSRAQSQVTNLRKSLDGVLQEHRSYADAVRGYDIFLSHSYLDKETIAGLKLLLESKGLRVYVDWIDDRELSRSYVTPATANLLRLRMKSSKALLYAVSTNSSHSKWMPWELGYFDGQKGRVAIVPITGQGPEYRYSGQEYLGLYPYVTASQAGDLYVVDLANQWKALGTWLT